MPNILWDNVLEFGGIFTSIGIHIWKRVKYSLKENIILFISLTVDSGY